MKTCSFCGTSLNDGSRFCPECGRAAAASAARLSAPANPVSVPAAVSAEELQASVPVPPAQQEASGEPMKTPDFPVRTYLTYKK